MLAKPRRRQARDVRVTVEAEPRPDLRHLPPVHIETVEYATTLKFQVLRYLVYAIDRPRGHARVPQNVEPVCARLCQQQLLDVRNDLCAPGAAVGVCCVFRIGAVRGLADSLPEALPDIVVSKSEGNRLVGRVEALINGDHAVAATGSPRQLARAEKRDDAAIQKARHG